MKYNYLTLVYISKERRRNNFIKTLTCKARKQKIKCKIKKIKANIHARPRERELHIILISANTLMSFIVEKQIK